MKNNLDTDDTDNTDDESDVSGGIVSPPSSGRHFALHRLCADPAGKRATTDLGALNSPQARFPAGSAHRRWPKAARGARGENSAGARVISVLIFVPRRRALRISVRT